MEQTPPKKQVADKTGWFDKPGNFKLFMILFFASLAVLLIVDFFIHKHGDYHFESVPDFFAAYGFISCVLLVLVAKVLRMIVKRDENYYDD